VMTARSALQFSDGAAGPVLRAVPDLGWQDRGACRSEDPSLFFPEPGGGATRKARSVCAACPVRSSCLSYALSKDDTWGIWGGELFEAGHLIPQPVPVPRAPSGLSFQCRNEHIRTEENTHIADDGRVRCLDCERERCRDRRQRSRIRREREREREHLRQQRIAAERARLRIVAQRARRRKAAA
jgi:WhiB family transcriptional regulator, redox-sensing transcriptional regulator